MHDEWQAGDRRYPSEVSMERLYPERETDLSAELKSGDEHRGSTSKPHHSAGRGPIGRGESALQGPLDT
jgi:hypothetical protein